MSSPGCPATLGLANQTAVVQCKANYTVVNILIFIFLIFLRKDSNADGKWFVYSKNQRDTPAANSYLNCSKFLLESRLDRPYFQAKSFPLPRAIYFELLQLRLIENVHRRVQRGELTERGLARGTGISQPHLHNMLKGVRVLSPPMADLLLRHLHMSVLDLLDADEIAARHPVDRAG